jgi:hypothetical protein
MKAEHLGQILVSDLGGLVIAPTLAPGTLALLLVLTFVRREQMVNRPAEFV